MIHSFMPRELTATLGVAGANLEPCYPSVKARRYQVAQRPQLRRQSSRGPAPPPGFGGQAVPPLPRTGVLEAALPPPLPSRPGLGTDPSLQQSLGRSTQDLDPILGRAAFLSAATAPAIPSHNRSSNAPLFTGSGSLGGGVIDQGGRQEIGPLVFRTLSQIPTRYSPTPPPLSPRSKRRCASLNSRAPSPTVATDEDGRQYVVPLGTAATLQERIPSRASVSAASVGSGGRESGASSRQQSAPPAPGGPDSRKQARSSRSSTSQSKRKQRSEKEGKHDAPLCDDAGFRAAALSGWCASLVCSPSLKRKPPKYRVQLLKSVFEGQPPVIFFDYEPSCGQAPRDSSRVMTDEELEIAGLAGALPKMQYAHLENDTVHLYNASANTLKHAGFQRTQDIEASKWALMWGFPPSPEVLRTFHPFQKTNHFPSSGQLGRKDLLWRNVARMKRQFPQTYDIMPHGFILPEDHRAWVSARKQNPNALWIYKPADQSCGKGIRLYGSALEASTDKKLAQKNGVVQRYVDNPLLINGFKFDLRLYVVVTSYDPLKIYLNDEGLVRLATERYTANLSTISHRTMHLTNYSVNKHSEAYVMNLDQRGAESPSRKPAAGGDSPASFAGEDEGDGEAAESEGAEEAAAGASAASPQQASKWALGQLREYCEEQGYDYDLIMERIKDVIIKTLLSVEPTIVNMLQVGSNFTNLGPAPGPQANLNQSCFEIYGFDIMVDDTLKPWLLEVNIFPSLSSSSPFDKRVKTKLIADSLTIAGLVPYDHELVTRAVKEEQTKRLQGLGPKPGAAGRSHSLQSITSASLRDLGEAEWRVILEAQDEYMRRGSLQRIYPREEVLARYAGFFPSPRYSNLVLGRWLEAGGSRIFDPSSGLDSELPPWVPRQRCFDAC